jgi:hypothetical protein
MASGKLHSLSIERAHRFGGPVLLLSDGDGLYFRKQTREGAAWMFRYRFGGRERWMTLGNYPALRSSFDVRLAMISGPSVPGRFAVSCILR